MASWPDEDDARDYIGEVRDEDTYTLSDCLDAAIEYVEYRCDLSETGDTDIGANVREAILMMTSRLFRRRLTPEGVAAFGEFGAVRVSSVDPDIERLLTQSRSWGFA